MSDPGLLGSPLPAPERARYAVERQEEIYGRADGPIWQRAIYDLLHEGWELASIGGLPFLRGVAAQARLGPGARVLELGCGGGAACHYLARLTGCHATGVERNGAQLQRALARRLRVPEAGCLTFEAGDISCYRSAQPFDAAFVLDTLSLLPDPDAALRSARGALRKEAWLFVADLGRTAATRPEIVEQAFRDDGFCSLVDLAEGAAALSAAGFDAIAARDRTDQATAGFGAVMAWLERADPRAEGVAPEVLDAWRETTGFYLDAFRTGELAYRWWQARAAIH